MALLPLIAVLMIQASPPTAADDAAGGFHHEMGRAGLVHEAKLSGHRAARAKRKAGRRKAGRGRAEAQQSGERKGWISCHGQRFACPPEE
jgi:hypothetical protein